MKDDGLLSGFGHSHVFAVKVNGSHVGEDRAAQEQNQCGHARCLDCEAS